LLAQSLVSDPKLVLLDEPLANLDPASVQEIVALLGRISRERNMAVILTAHDMNPLLPVLDRIVYLAKGHAAVGTTQEVARTDVLTRLYGSPIEVVTVHGRVVILPASGAPDTEAVHHSEPVQREPLP
jgi:zinc/manganese transport system ATP-binding protein